MLKLENLGLDVDIYKQIKRMAEGKADSFTNSQLKKINDTLDYRKGSKGNLTLLIDSSRKTYENISKKSNNNYDSITKNAIENEKQRAKNHVENYRNIKKDLRKLLGKGKNKKDVATELLNILKQRQKNKASADMNKILQRFKNETDKNVVLNFYKGQLTTSDINNILKVLGYDMNWYRSMIDFYKSKGLSSSEAVEATDIDINAMTNEYLDYIIKNNNLSFKHDDGSIFNNEEIYKSLENVGVDSIIIKYLSISNEYIKKAESKKKASETFEVWDNWE